MSEQSAVDGGPTSRGNSGGRGKAATERAKKAKEDIKRKREIEKDKQMEELSTNISDIGAVLKKKIEMFDHQIGTCGEQRSYRGRYIESQINCTSYGDLN